MFFLYDANLKLLKTIPSDVYQGSDGADDIYFLVPINPNAAINVAFLLPTGKTLTSRTATKQGEALGLKTPDGAVYSMWSITLTAQETAYAGNVTLQITVVAGTMNMTSQKAVFPVLHGVAPILPEAPTTDVYTDIQATISALQTAVYNTKSVGIKSFVAQGKDAYVAEYEDDATRVVVPDYYLKDDTYYPVTMVYPLSGGTANITEYEFGNNITTIGTSAFYETKVETLEFPNTLANIGDNAFENARTTTFVFNGAVPKIEADAFKGVTATAYVPAVYYADYVTAFESYPGIAVVKKSETLADVILTADEAKATADKVKTQVNGKLNIDSSGTDYPQVYGKDYTGAQTMFDIAEGSAGKTLVRRDKNGKTNVADAVDEANAVNKKQLDASVTALEASISTAQSTADEAKNGLANKVDIIEKTNDWKVYARGFWIDGSDLKSLVCTNKPTQYTVVQYGQNGMFTVNDATADQHPVPLKQAKSLLSDALSQGADIDVQYIRANAYYLVTSRTMSGNSRYRPIRFYDDKAIGNFNVASTDFLRTINGLSIVGTGDLTIQTKKYKHILRAKYAADRLYQIYITEILPDSAEATTLDGIIIGEANTSVMIGLDNATSPTNEPSQYEGFVPGCIIDNVLYFNKTEDVTGGVVAVALGSSDIEFISDVVEEI